MAIQPISSRPRKRLTPAERDEIVRIYERGEKFGDQLAEMFGVHRNTIYAILKRAGAIRGCRVDEVLAPYIAELDERRRQALLAQQVKDKLWIERANAMMRPVDEFMAALLRADREGTMEHFGRDRRAAPKAA